MKTVIKRILFFAIIGCITQTVFAQGAEVCYGSAYTIADAVPASANSEYQWVENGNVLSGTNQATYSVPASKWAGVYTYVRQSKSSECPDCQSSNEFTVTVFDCAFTAGTTTSATATFTDPRDGKQYKTVVMPDGRTWFGQNLNYTKDLTHNAYVAEANGRRFTSAANGIPAIGSYWCPPQYYVSGVETAPVVSGTEVECNVYGVLYTWETAMMVDGKYSDEAKAGSAWEESWVSPYYYSGVVNTNPNADRNNARGGTDAKSGGRGICPMGWYIPTEYEWAYLLDKVEGDGTGDTFKNLVTGLAGLDVGIKLKSTGTFTPPDPGDGTWRNSDVKGTDEYGFRMLPTGYYHNKERIFFVRGDINQNWSSSVNTNQYVYNWHFRAYYSGALRAGGYRSYGSSVRCIKD